MADRVDVRPLFEKMERAEARVYNAVTALLDVMDRGGDALRIVEELRARCAEVAAAEQAWSDAIDHNRRISALQAVQ